MPEDTVSVQPTSTAPQTAPAVDVSSPKKGGSKLPLLALLALVVVAVIGVGAYLMFSKTVKPVAKEASTTTTTTTTTTTVDANTIVVWSWNTAASALQELVPAFNKVYPNIKVKIVSIPYNTANSQFATAISTGVGFPDVWDTEGPVTPGYIADGSLMDITALASKYQNDFVPYKWAEVTSNGKVYGLPWDSAPVGTFYRADLFKAAGVDVASINTWDDFIAAGKKVTKAPNQYMTLMSKTADVGDFFQTLLCEFGGSEYDTAGNLTFNNPQGVQAVTLMKKILDSGVGANIGWWTPEFYNGIKSGEITSLTTGVWMGGQIATTAPADSGKWAVMPVPATTIGGVRSAVRGGSNLAIASKSQKADMAWKFIEFTLANKDSQLKMYKDFQIFPALKSTYTDPAFSTPNAYFGNQNTSQLFIQAQNVMPLTYHYGPHSIEVNNIISSEVVLAINGKKPIQQALTDAETAANKIVKASK